MPDENILITLSVDASSLINAAKQSRAQINNIKTDIKSIASEAKVSFEIAGNALKEAFAQKVRATIPQTGDKGAIAQATREANAEIAKYNKQVDIAKRELTAAQGPAMGFASAIQSIGKAMQIAFGIGIFQLISKLISGFGELIKTGEEFASTLFKLGASVRSLQKQGLNITMKGTLEQIRELRKEFGVFSTKDIAEGVAQIQLLTRQFGFTSEEMLNLTRITAALGVVLEKDFKNMAASIALFLSSGYGEALQRAGIAVNRLSVVEEAHRMGIQKSYTALTEYERAHAGYNLIVSQSSDILKELTGYQQTYIGQIQTQKALVEDLNNALALGLTPLNLAWAKTKTIIANGLIWILNQTLKNWSLVAATFIAGFATIVMAYQNAKSVIKGQGPIFDTQDMLDMWKETFRVMQEEVEKVQIKPIDIETLTKFTGLDAAAEAAAKKQNDEAENMLKIMKDLTDGLLDLQRDYNEASTKLWDDYTEDRQKIIDNASEDMTDAYQDLLDDLADIEKDYAKSVANAQRDAQRKLADLADDTRDRTAEANDKYRENEEKAERDHQERLRRLREEYLFDLEDALRQRDALQVLRLMRRYKLDKEQENRDYKNRLEDLKNAHKDELEEIKKSEADKRREILESLDEQLADLRANYEEKKAERQADYDKEIQEIQENRDKALAERQAQYEKELQDLQNAFWGAGGKLEEMLKQWAETNGVTETQAKAITDTLAKYFGEMGISDSIFNYYKSSVAGIVADVLEQERVLELAAAQALALQQQITDALNAAAAARASLGNAFGGVTPSGPSSSYFGGGSSGAGTKQNPTNTQFPGYPAGWHPPMVVPPGYPAFAGGVSNMMLTRPKLFMAGEVPERLDITPLSQLNSGKIGGNGNGTNGKAKVEIALGSDLEGRIIDSTLSEFDVILTREMSRK